MSRDVSDDLVCEKLASVRYLNLGQVADALAPFLGLL